MEDEHLALPSFVPRDGGSSGASLFAVFDGHGGRHCATFLKFVPLYSEMYILVMSLLTW